MDNHPRQKLCEIITRYGQAICEEPGRCEGYLRDYCSEYRGEANVLINALKERVAFDLLNSSASVPVELLLGRLELRLQTNQGMTPETARWAVESWALALGRISTPTPPASSPPKPPVSTPLKPPASTPPNWDHSPSRPKPFPVGLVVAMALAAGIIVFWIYTSRKETPNPVPVPQSSPTSVAKTPEPQTNLPGKIVINTVPAGASVVLDGANQGLSPLIINNVIPTNHLIQLTLTGYEPLSLVADVKSGGSVDFGTITMAAVTPAPTATPPPPTFSARSPASTIYQDVKDFVRSHMQKTVNNDLESIVSDYSERVDYYTDGIVNRNFIRADRQKFVQSWPDFSIQFISDVQVTDTGDTNVKIATFNYNFIAKNSARGKRSAGSASDTWTIVNTSSGLQISGAREAVTNRYR
jgi:hypothetical protein